MNVLAYLEVHRFLCRERMSNVWRVANVLRSVGVHVPAAEGSSEIDLVRMDAQIGGFTLAWKHTLPGRRYI